ncbi:MAG: hypothetical protein EBR82_12315 [Caulobacteraceae bacterium]|nr:hypothetical protein [Caulobacteraceae bacterium]
MKGRYARVGGHQLEKLTEEERRTIVLRYGVVIAPGARALGVSTQTYEAAIDPGGRIARPAIERIRARLSEGPIDPATGKVIP